MDLIYTNENRVDIAVIPEYNLDLAFGKDENDFEIEMSIESGCLKQNYFIYIEDTQYGGIVDNIVPSTLNKTVKYIGRTWHGILDSKIVSPDKGQDYLVLNGESNRVLKQLILIAGLESLFEVSNEVSSIVINNYNFPRYSHLYQGVRKMLYDFGGKLNLYFSNGKVHLSVSPYVDYSRDEEWDASEFSMEINKHFNPVNHLYCLGKGDLKNRYVIELFTDENGSVQPYATIDEPYMDSQYILDTRNQILRGMRDHSQVYDYGNAQITENYETLTTRPDNWSKSYPNYYKYSFENNNYEELKREYQDTYYSLEVKPDDWYYAWATYYYKKGDEYKEIDDSFIVKETTYPLLGERPIDWKKNYKNYYYYWTDGVQEEYRSVEGVKYNAPEKHKRIPEDWSTNKGNYYIHVKEYEYTYEFKKKRNGVWDKWETTYDFKIEEFNKKDYKCKLIKQKLVRNKKVKISDYVKEKDSKGRRKAKLSDFKDWKHSKFRPFYTMYTKEHAPIFDRKIHRFKSEATSSPAFKPNTFYEKVEKEVIPYFYVGGYFRKVYDNYADLVANGLIKLQEYWSLDDVTISLTSDETEYDIGDVVGATENITGVSITSQITKKIINIQRNNISIQYGLGDDDTKNTY